MGYYRRGNRNRNYYKNKKYYKKKNNPIYESIEMLFFLLSLPFKAIFALVKFIGKCTEKTEYTNPQNSSNYHSPALSHYTNYEKVRAFESAESEKAEEKKYEAKDIFITECEKKFFDAIKSIVGENYIVQPQINLASIVNKVTADKYRNELLEI